MSVILLIFMSDIFFCICLMRDVLLLLSTILYVSWLKYPKGYDLNININGRMWKNGSHMYRGISEY